MHKLVGPCLPCHSLNELALCLCIVHSEPTTYNDDTNKIAIETGHLYIIDALIKLKKNL